MDGVDEVVVCGEVPLTGVIVVELNRKNTLVTQLVLFQLIVIWILKKKFLPVIVV